MASWDRVFCIALLLPFSASLLNGCENVLGIETSRKYDPAFANAGGECVQGGDCSSCASAYDSCMCQGKTAEQCQAADDSAPECSEQSDSCLECACDRCPDAFEACTEDSQCKAILGCVRGANCDPGLVSANTCYRSEACQGVIDANGGPEAAPMEHLEQLVACAAEAECTCASDCSKDGGCVGCMDCHATCVCQGNTEAVCQERCGETTCTFENGCTGCVDCMAQCHCEANTDAECQSRCTPADCSPDSGCQNCADCVASCQCDGGTAESCTTTCSAGSCLPEDNCTGCQDCYSVCRCEGGSDAACTQECSSDASCTLSDNCQACPTCLAQCRCRGRNQLACAAECGTQVSNLCSPDAGCSTCGTCVGECQCNGGSLQGCLENCGLDTCGSDCSECSGCVDACLCGGDSPQRCIQTCLGDTCENLALGACDACGCDVCPQEFGECHEEPGCTDLVSCALETGCRGEGCLEAGVCLSAVVLTGGRTSRAAALAEALLTCQDRQGCACGMVRTNEVPCGAAICAAYQPPPPAPILPACCPQNRTDTCGIDVNPYLMGACEPTGQPGIIDAACPSLSAPGEPYPDGATLQGCCRSEGVCGFMDDQWLNLGCAKSELFGKTDPLGCSAS